MDHTSSPTAEEVFLEAIGRAPGERSAYLDSACGEDTALRAEVELLVACHDGAGGFLEEFPASGFLVVDDFDIERMPERIGKYDVLRVLGAGGMGCVYLAESREPRRKVALKVVRPGLSTTEMMRRFRHEVQAVALLKHPAIAQLYEAGVETTAGGPMPYFAMEYVEGPTIAGYARERGLSWREKMQLVARVAAGVQHAHQKGVIHRDLKPGNILVDASGEPKILDFGVARLLEQDGAASIQTRPGQLMGTLSYMSPEQLSGDAGAVDARADIYALGVILYELLAGAPPYDVASMSLADAVKAIRETEPRALREVDRSLRGDAEVIVAKAMAKEPERRYQSAQELAGDIERCVADEPITARRASAAYQLSKFTNRNKLLVGVSVAALVSLVGGLVVSVWQARVAVAERAKAEDNRGIAEGINDFIEDLFASAEPDIAKKTDVTVREVLGRSTVESIRKKFPDQARLRMRLNGTIGRTYKSLSMLSEAEPHLVEAAMIARAEMPADSAERLTALKDLGHLYKLQDRFAEGETNLREATEAAERVYGPDAEETIGCRNDLASLLLRRGEAGEAEQLFAASAEGAQRKLGESHTMTLVSLNNLSSAMKAGGKRDEAIGIRRRLLDLCLEHMGEENHGTITAMNNLAKDMLDAGMARDAEPLLRRALALRLKIQGPEHRSTLNTRCNLGSCLAALGELEKAREELAEVVRLADEHIPAGNIDAAKYDHEYGRVLMRLERFEEAEKHLRRAYDALAATLGAKNRQATGVARDLADLYTRQNRAEEARAWSEKAMP